MNPQALSPRAKRRRRLQQRQTVIYGLLIAGLAVAAAFAYLVFSGTVPSPWTRPITMPEKIETSETMECPPEGAYSVAFGSVKANVFNSSNQQGIAVSVAGTLREYGVTVDEVGNWPKFLRTDGQLQAGKAGIVAAYTLQQVFPTMQVMIDDREDASVDVILGHTYGEQSLIKSGDFPAGVEIVPPAECIPEEEPTEDELNDGGEDLVPEDEETEAPSDGEEDAEA